MSTFHGLEMAKRALSAQQSALYTTGHNISNANTEGYSRQRVNFETMNPYPSASRNRPQIPGQYGTGVQVGSVERIRNLFLDQQFRMENSKSGYWETKSNALSRLEGLMNEPSETGLAKTMDQFWQSIQDLAVNPDNSGARSVVVQQGISVAETFNHLSNSMQSIQTDLTDQMDSQVQGANQILDEIEKINQQVKKLESQGYVANDLYDERDRLVDELSNIVNIKVNMLKSDNSNLPAGAAGMIGIELLDNSGKELGITLLDPNMGRNTIEFDKADLTVTVNDQSILNANGSLKGLLDSYEDYSNMLGKLDKLANEFAVVFNDAHGKGYDLNGNEGIAFFVMEDGESFSAKNIKVNDDLVDAPDKLAASSETNETGNGENASSLAKLFEDTFPNLGEGTFNGFYQSMIGTLGVDAKNANRMTENTGITRTQVENQRMSVSSVSLDEEMTNMIKFQHAYNASARSMTTIDEMIDRIINNMGLVGR